MRQEEGAHGPSERRARRGMEAWAGRAVWRLCVAARRTRALHCLALSALFAQTKTLLQGWSRTRRSLYKRRKSIEMSRCCG